jgi:hypothetical protein
MSQPPPERPPDGGAPADPAARGGGRDNRKRTVSGLVAALLALLVVVAVLGLTRRGGDRLDTTANDDSATSAPTAASPSAPSAAPSTAESTAPSPLQSTAPSRAPVTSSSTPGASSASPLSGRSAAAPSVPGDPAGFLARLPLGFTDCAAATRAGDGDVAAAVCRAATAQPALVQAVFHLYPDQATLDAVFDGQATTEWVLSAFADGAGCSTATGYGPWSHPDRTRGGQLACQVTGEGDVLLAWTDDAFLTEGTIRVPGNSQAEMTALHDWWTSHRDFRP